jgi:hypothetical protein
VRSVTAVEVGISSLWQDAKQLWGVQEWFQQVAERDEQRRRFAPRP